MSTVLYNAHAHVPDADEEPSEHLKNKPLSSTHFSPEYSIVNGTSPADWADVLQLARKHIEVLPAIGLHPLEVSHAPDHWKTSFLKILDNDSICAIGEIGLDRRDRSADVEKQLDAFCWQLKQAHKHEITVSIHCVKASGLLMDTLRTHDLPSQGIHLHAYNGSLELVPELAEMGAYFSFAAKQLKSNSKKILHRIRAIPIRRLLIETDLAYGSDCSILHACYEMIAQIREMPLEQLYENITENFESCFQKSK